MLTNPYETQVVQSLGVRIGPDKGASAASRGCAGGKCPFPAMISAAEAVRSDEPTAVRWTAAAEARLANIPEFVRPMAKTGIERFAREQGAAGG